MAKYRVEIENMEVVDCNKVLKSERPIDFAVIEQWKGFVDIDPAPPNAIRAYLCNAKSPIEAKIIAVEYLEKVKKNRHRDGQ